MLPGGHSAAYGSNVVGVRLRPTFGYADSEADDPAPTRQVLGSRGRPVPVEIPRWAEDLIHRRRQASVVLDAQDLEHIGKPPIVMAAELEAMAVIQALLPVESACWGISLPYQTGALVGDRPVRIVMEAILHGTASLIESVLTWVTLVYAVDNVAGEVVAERLSRGGELRRTSPDNLSRRWPSPKEMGQDIDGVREVQAPVAIDITVPAWGHSP